MTHINHAKCQYPEWPCTCHSHERADLEAERDSLRLQVSEAMKACTWATHDRDHTEPRHCVASLASLIELRDIERRGADKRVEHEQMCQRCYAKVASCFGMHEPKWSLCWECREVERSEGRLP